MTGAGAARLPGPHMAPRAVFERPGQMLRRLQSLTNGVKI